MCVEIAEFFLNCPCQFIAARYVNILFMMVFYCYAMCAACVYLFFILRNTTFRICILIFKFASLDIVTVIISAATAVVRGDVVSGRNIHSNRLIGWHANRILIITKLIIRNGSYFVIPSVVLSNASRVLVLLLLLQSSRIIERRKRTRLFLDRQRQIKNYKYFFLRF